LHFGEAIYCSPELALRTMNNPASALLRQLF
jgi:hypothetical protein